MERILVVEDEHDLADEIMFRLEQAGYQVTLANNGKSALDIALDNRPDLILTDIMMPEMNGFELVENLQSHTELGCTPVIFLSALNKSQNIRNGMNLGADDYLTKPFSSKDLLDAIRTRLKKARENRQLNQNLLHAHKSFQELVAHELRTPLTPYFAIQYLLEVNDEQLTQDNIKKITNMISSSNDRMLHIVEQFEYYLNIETLKHNVKAKTSIAELVFHAIERIDSHYLKVNTNRIQINGKYFGIAASLYDSSGISKALAEILHNALRFSDAATPVDVDFITTGESVWMNISDYGTGMTEDEIELALKPFNQVNRLKNEQQGVGLGLPLAVRLIEQQGGTLHINSTPQLGTQVTVHLP